MKKETYEAQKAFAGEKKPSMLRRFVGHDYTDRQIYMITMVTEGCRPLFGRIVGRSDAPKGCPDEPRVELSELGRRVVDEWWAASDHHPEIEVVALQMMPDHLHGILFVKERLPVHLGQVITGFKAGCRKRMKQITAAEPLPAEKAKLLPTKKAGPLPAEKGLPTEKAFLRVTVSPSSEHPARPLFAKGYNDLILRSYDELGTWQNYLRDNPRRLMTKRSRPEFLRPFFDLKIGPYTFNGVGNRGLLQASRRIAVRVSRRLAGEELEKTVQYYLNEARQGAVLVSPAISPGEKRIMREAFDEGLCTIVIIENGFTPMSKPHGEQFYACSEGRLLMVSAWEHHNEKRVLTASQCSQMNLMAVAICKFPDV